MGVERPSLIRLSGREALYPEIKRLRQGECRLATQGTHRGLQGPLRGLRRAEGHRLREERLQPLLAV
jgi:hypothetical protein